MKRTYLPFAAVAVVALILGVVLFLREQARPAPAPETRLPDFHLTDATGRSVTQGALAGKPALLYFGYTFCPDVCPTELGWVARVLRLLGEDVAGINVVFVSIDPERDTPAALAEFAPMFHPAIQGFTGTPAEVAALATPLGVRFKRAEVATAKPGYYLMDHTSTVFLFDRRGDLVAKLGSTMRADVTAALIRRYL